MTDRLEKLRVAALGGDSGALQALILALVDGVHVLACRMVWDRDEAQDATQEILTKVVTKLAGFEARSSLKTWVYRIAVNHLLDRKRTEFEALSFDALAADLVDGLEEPRAEYQPELNLLAREVAVTCTGAMLLCLDREHRVAYVLGELLQFPSPAAAEIAGVSPATLRKRLERARTDIRAFMAARCGLNRPTARCHCTRRVNRAIELGRIGLTRPSDQRRARRAVTELRALRDANELMRDLLSTPCSVGGNERWQRLLDSSTALLGDQE